MTTPKGELAAVQKAMTEAFALKVLWAGKNQDAMDAKNAVVVELKASEDQLRSATLRAEQTCKLAITKAQKIHDEVKTKTSTHIDETGKAAADALMELKNFQEKVRADHGAVIDLVGAGNVGGGHTRL